MQIGKANRLIYNEILRGGEDRILSGRCMAELRRLGRMALILHDNRKTRMPKNRVISRLSK